MIKSKKQGVVFGLIMSYAMAIGMEVYNVAIKQGGLDSMTNSVFPAALKEAAYMGLIVFVFSNLWGNRAGAAFAARVCSIERDNAYFCRLMRQAGTVADNEPCGVSAFQHRALRRPCDAASGNMGRNCA